MNRPANIRCSTFLSWKSSRRVDVAALSEKQASLGMPMWLHCPKGVLVDPLHVVRCVERLLVGGLPVRNGACQWELSNGYRISGAWQQGRSGFGVWRERIISRNIKVLALSNSCLCWRTMDASWCKSWISFHARGMEQPNTGTMFHLLRFSAVFLLFFCCFPTVFPFHTSLLPVHVLADLIAKKWLFHHVHSSTEEITRASSLPKLSHVRISLRSSHVLLILLGSIGYAKRVNGPCSLFLPL